MYQIRRMHSPGSSGVKTVDTVEEAVECLRLRKTAYPHSTYKIFKMTEMEVVEKIVYDLKEVN